MANNDNSCMSFDIDREDYETFLENLRKELSKSSSHDIPALVSQSSPLSWLDVRLISGDESVTLRIERRNLYVRGYSTNGGTDFWEFSDSSLITGSRSLPYSGSYFEADGLCGTARVKRDDLPLGYFSLQNAISNLAVIENPDSDQEGSARLLLIIIQMITSATKIITVAEHIIQNWWNPRPITPRMVSLENVWGTVSSAVFRAGSNSDAPLPNVPNSQAIDTSSDASYIRTLVRIEYICVNNFDDLNPRQLFGTVMVKDCWGDHTAYDRRLNNPESKRPGEYVSLTGPSVAISGEDAFIISVSLWDHDALSPDNEIVKGEIVWDPRNRDWSYNQPLEEDVSGKHGSVSVGYSVIRKALSATIKVVMINGDEESPAEVYGTIKASGVLGESSTTRMLFNKSVNECVKGSLQQSIPLTCPIFPVPVDSNLTIEANLWNHDSLSPDNQIALGSVQFTPVAGTQKKNITGEHGEVEVCITCE